MRSNPGGQSFRCNLLAVVSFALALAMFWNIVLLNQKVACDLSATKLTADASQTINTLRSQNEILKSAIAETDCTKLQEDAEKCGRELADIERRNAEKNDQCSPSSLSATRAEPRLAVIMFCYNRPEYLERALKSLLQYMPQKYSLIVSQDSDDQAVAKLLARPEFAPRLLHIQYVNGRVNWRNEGKGGHSSYYFISSHYRFGLNTVFNKLNYDAVILLEDDLEISADFFSYFDTTLPLLQSDPSLYCVSAWNDNGNPDFVDEKHARELRRSDFFPGLGWLMTRALWNELGPTWPDGFWDDWMRLPSQRKGRHCIFPEISRTYTFGAIGASQGQFFKDHLASIVLNKQAIDWATEDLSYLSLDKWDERFEKELQEASAEVTSPPSSIHSDIVTLQNQKVSVYYDSDQEFKTLANALKVMSDMKEGVPRTAYRGVVKFHLGTSTVFLRPRTLPPRLKPHDGV